MKRVEVENKIDIYNFSHQFHAINYSISLGLIPAGSLPHCRITSTLKTSFISSFIAYPFMLRIVHKLIRSILRTQYIQP